MKRLLQMIEQVKVQKEIPMLIHGLDPLKNALPEAFKPEMFFHFVEHVQPFVFSPKNKSPEELDHDEIYKLEHQNEDNMDFINRKIDSPFKVWSAEIAGDGFITVPRDGVFDSEGKLIGTNAVGVAIISFLCVERAPGELMYFIYVKVYRNDGSSFNTVCLTTELDSVAEALIKRLYKENTGIEPGRRKIKIGTGENKKHVKISRVIYVRPKKLVAVDTLSECGKEIDWTHRWTVRGHWVSLGEGKVGKDRDGNYCVNGQTWRVEHIKGPDDKPLINKTRIVEDK